MEQAPNNPFRQVINLEDVIAKTIERLQPTIVKAAEDAATKAAVAVAEQSSGHVDKLKARMERKRKMKHGPLQHKGNQEQYNAAVKILDTIDDSLESLEENELNTAKGCLQIGKKLVLSRIKLIRIADREDWLTAREFENDDLVSGSDEKKRLKKAVKSARDNKSDKPKSSGERYSMDNVTCYNCRRVGHHSTHCPFYSKGTLASISSAIPTDRKK